MEKRSAKTFAGLIAVSRVPYLVRGRSRGGEQAQPNLKITKQSQFIFWIQCLNILAFGFGLGMPRPGLPHGSSRRRRAFEFALFLGRAQRQLQGMDRAGELVGEERMHAALALDPALAFESRGDDLEPEMGFLAARGAGVMARVKMGVVVDDEMLGLQTRFELAADTVGDDHGLGFALFVGSVKQSFAAPPGR